MKKFIAFLLSLSLLVCVVSCNNSETTTENTVQTSFTSNTENTTTASTSTVKYADVDYETELSYTVRINPDFEEGREENYGFIIPEPVLVSSVSDLVLPRMHSQITPESVYERYNEEFFKENFLYVYQFATTGSSEKPYIKSIEVIRGKQISLQKRYYSLSSDGSVSADIVCWVLFIPIPRELADGTEEIIFN
ncbi:MAG: hypothetical protein E7608_01915 [Ruminococcaceae bacterium]|nr:hypothetical protein [Oscillospiraceae bacterium]